METVDDKGVIVEACGTYADLELGDFLENVPYRERSRLQGLAA
jgi:hypothetical protein